jgi:hypothetical protein
MMDKEQKARMIACMSCSECSKKLDKVMNEIISHHPIKLMLHKQLYRNHPKIKLKPLPP